jgi:hypothetical protein
MGREEIAIAMRYANAVRGARFAAGAFAAAFAFATPALAGGEERPVRGWLENAFIEPAGLRLDAKLDTGARTSSIHAEILRAPNLDESPAPPPAEEATAASFATPAEPAPDAEPDAEAGAADAGAAPEAEAGPDAAPRPSSGDEIVDREDFEEVEVEESDFDAFDDDTIVFRVSNEQGESTTLQRTIVRYVQIKNRDGTTQRRPVVEITVCLAGVWVTGEVNLADRTDFNYPLLVGRNMLELSGIIVDPREIYTRSARCPGVAP